METNLARQVEKQKVHIQLLGGFSVSISGEAVSPEQWRSRRARNLVKLLALSPGHRLHRDQVIDLLWPESSLTAGANNFHQHLYTARRVFGSLVSGFLCLEDGVLSLSGGKDSDLTVDMDQFEAEAARLRESQDPAEYQAAVALYRGDLLPDDLYEEWTVRARERLRQTYLRLLLDLAQLCETRQSYPEGIESVQRLLENDPGNEEGTEELMRLYALNGQRQMALRQYQALCSLVKAEFDTQPSQHIQGLYDDIQSGRFPKGPPSFQEARKTGEPPAVADAGDSPPGNLPIQMTSFIGREKEQSEILKLLEEHRLVTLTGSGGTGKTRLALKVASEMMNRYADGAWLVELAKIDHPEAISQTTAAVFGLQESKNQNYQVVLTNFLRQKHLALVLDNCEHVLDACARIVHELLQVCPHLVIITTSREPLGIAGEFVYRVPSLAVPDPNALPAEEELTRFDAVRLFIERAAAVLPGLPLSWENLRQIARICIRLDGIPLAIELAAVRVNVLSVEQIANRLDDRFRLLTGGNRVAMPRQRTLRASMDWSYSLLTEPERVLLRRLSIFYGGWTLESAEAVCAIDGLEAEGVLDTLSALVSKSLIVADQLPRSATRYRMLETVRQYAQEKLVDMGEAARARDCHLSYFLSWVEEIEPGLKTGRAPALMDQLDVELDNLRAALDWASSKNTQEGNEQELRLFVGMWLYWIGRGLDEEGIHWGKSGLERFQTPDARTTLIRAAASFTMGYLLANLAFYEMEWKAYLEESIALYRASANRSQLALALAFYRQNILTHRQLFQPTPDLVGIDARALEDESLSIISNPGETCPPGDAWTKAMVLYWTGNSGDSGDQAPEEPPARIQEASVIFSKLGYLAGETVCAITLGDMATDRGDLPAARDHFLRALELAHVLKSKHDLGNIFGRLGWAAYYRRDFLEMEQWFQQSHQLFSKIGAEFHSIWPQRMLGKAVLHQGDPARARAIFLENLGLGEKYAEPYTVLSNLLGLAGCAAASGGPERAVRLLAFLEKTMETFHKPLDNDDREEFHWHLETVRSQVDPLVFARLWEAGRGMSLEEAITEAKGGLG